MEVIDITCGCKIGQENAKEEVAFIVSQIFACYSSCMGRFLMAVEWKKARISSHDTIILHYEIIEHARGRIAGEEFLGIHSVSTVYWNYSSVREHTFCREKISFTCSFMTGKRFPARNLREHL